MAGILRPVDLKRAAERIIGILAIEGLPALRILGTPEPPNAWPDDWIPEDPAGLCWDEGDECVIWVSSVMEPIDQLATLTHELGHALLGPEKLHDADFRAWAHSVGFRRPYRQSRASPRLRALLEGILASDAP